MDNNTFNSVFDSPNNYSYLMGSSDGDLLNNQPNHIIRNIDNNIMEENRSTNILELDENLNKIKSNILLFLKNDNNDEYFKTIEDEIKQYNEPEPELEKESEPEPKPEPEPELEKESEPELEKGPEKTNNEILLESYKIFLKDYIKVQDSFLEADNKLKKNITKTKKDIKLLNSAIDYTKILTDEYISDSDNNDIVEQIKKIGDVINKNNNIYLIKKDYVKKRKELNKYLDIIKSINLNSGNNMCTVCMTKPVNKYFNPCGHTCCSECIDRIKEYEGHHRLTCLICRVNVMDVRNIYFN